MKLLEPDWNQPKPSSEEAAAMCRRIALDRVTLPAHRFDEFVRSINLSHHNGGVQIAALDIGADSVFDWFASRNRLWEFDILDGLLVRSTIREAVPELRIPETLPEGAGFGMETPFTLDGGLASSLYIGGAYHKAKGDGRKEKELALSVCDAMFDLRFGEVNRYTSAAMWTTWFYGIAWDSSDVIFDRRLRRLWLLVITDTD